MLATKKDSRRNTILKRKRGLNLLGSKKHLGGFFGARGKIKLISKEKKNQETVKSPGRLFRKIVILLKILPVIFSLVGILWLLGRIKTTQVDCRSQYGICNRLVRDKLSTISGKPLIFSKKAATEILEGQVSVDKYLIHYKLPSKLQVDIIEQKPGYSIKGSEGQYFNINYDGLVVSKTNDSSLPTIEVKDSNYVAGDIVHENIKFALSILENLFANYPVEKAEKVGDNLVIDIEGVSAIFPLEGDRDYLLGAFVLIFGELKKEGGDIRIDKEKKITLDLRYNNPVLKLE